MQQDLLALVGSALAGRYLVDRMVGQGGMATVYRAEERGTGRIVAIKVLDPGLARVLGTERFLLEVETLRRLDHPGILPLLDSGEADSILYYVMPFVEGETLRHRLKQQLQLPLEEAVGLMRTVLEAVGYAHRQNVVHRDIKPENILLQDGRPIVADFGIARAIVRSGGTTFSTTGFAVGTSAYMSPEQASADPGLDGRSDIYSAACVLFEMLAGGPPFSGPTPQAIQARHVHEPPPPIGVVRPGIPSPLVAAIEKGLAKVPADRYATAEAFATALEQALRPGATAGVRRTPRRVWRAVAAGGAVLAVAAGWLASRLPDRGALDPDKHIVLPFRYRDNRLQGSAPLSEADITQLVVDGLRRWPDLKLVNQILIDEAIRRRGVPTTLSEALALARELGAGLLIWGEIYGFGDSVRVEASVFDVTRPRDEPVRSGRVPFPGSIPPDDAAITTSIMADFASLAASLVLPAMASASPAWSVATQSFRALRAALAGDSALRAWDFESAREHYQAALAADPAFVEPKLRLARIGSWSGEERTAWLGVAEAATNGTGVLDPISLLEASALLALARGQYPDACRSYRSIVAQDSASFVGWYGVGECLTRDHAVITDPASPSGYRFRTSYEEGLRAFERALTLAPLSHAAFGGYAVERLAARLFVDFNQLRGGAPEKDGSAYYLAVPGMDADTLVFVPWPAAGLLNGHHLNPTRQSAVLANRRRLLAITSNWFGVYPTSEPALRAHAIALELAGLVVPGTPKESALGALQALRGQIDRARTDGELALWEVRILVKAGRYRAALALIDSTVDREPASTTGAQAFAVMLALTGRIHAAADLLGRFPAAVEFVDGDRPIVAPREVAGPAAQLLLYATLGVPADSVRRYAGLLENAVQRAVPANERAALLGAALRRPALLAFPILPPPRGATIIEALERFLADGDSAAARAQFDRLDGIRGPSQPGSLSVEVGWLEARLRRRLGDTNGAHRTLELAAGDLIGSGLGLLADPSHAAALVPARAAVEPKGPESIGVLWMRADADLVRTGLIAH